MAELSERGKEFKAKLESIRGKKKLLKSIERQIAEARYSIGAIKVDYSTPTVQGGASISAQERFAILIDNLERRYNKVMEEVFELEDSISSGISELSETEQSMIIDRYVSGWSWEKIRKRYSYCRRQTIRIVNNSINKIADKNSENLSK